MKSKNNVLIDTSKLPISVIKNIARNLGWEDGEDLQPYIERISAMPPKDALNNFLAWQGIMGYTASIWNAVENLMNASTVNDEK